MLMAGHSVSESVSQPATGRVFYFSMNWACDGKGGPITTSVITRLVATPGSQVRELYCKGFIVLCLALASGPFLEAAV